MAKDARIAILTGSHLCHNPRVLKEAAALGRAGYEVTVLGGWLDVRLKKEDCTLTPHAAFQFKPVLDMTGNAAVRAIARVRTKLGRAVQRCGVELRWQLGYAYSALRRAAFRTDADLYIAHSEQAMAVAADLLRAGKRVGVDMEDWFSADLPPEGQSRRPLKLLRMQERELLCRSAISLCPSKAMSVALAKAYRCRPPDVIYNAFSWRDRHSIDGLSEDKRGFRKPSIYWFSQTIGLDRGLEDLIEALPLIQGECEVHLRGRMDAQFRTWFADKVPAAWRERVCVHPQVPQAELISRLAEHDIGFAGEMIQCRSRDLTVTNKILHYLSGGLAVVASDTQGQREIAEGAPGAILLYPSGRPAQLAAQINKLLASREMLLRAKAAALHAAQFRFSWEHEEPKLLAAAAKALTS